MNFKNIILVIILVSATLVGCKKYEDGPGFSLRSKEGRVANTWKVESFTINSIDNTSLLKNENYMETYDKDGNYSFSTNTASGFGKWEFQSDKEEIKRTGVSGQSSQTIIILRLTENEFWYYYMDGNDRYELHLEDN